MITPKNRTFAQILNGYVHWLFTSDDLPEYNEANIVAVDVTSVSPSPQVGWAAVETNGVWSLSAPTQTSAQLWAAHKNAALAALSDADVTMIRVSEAVALGLTSWTNSDVVAFVNYRRELRSIISASSGDGTQPLPTKPSYPAGT